MKVNSFSSWERLRTMSDDDVDASDIAQLDDSFFADVECRSPSGKVSVVLNVDEEIIEWYRQQKGSLHGLINAALRDYADAHR